MSDTSQIVAQLLYAQRQQVTLQHRHAALVERNNVDNSEYIDLYSEQLKQSTNELKLLTELIAQIKKILSRRKSGTSRHSAVQNNVQNTTNIVTQIDTTLKFASLSQYRSTHNISSKQKLDIWTHDTKQQDLPIGLRVAALTDENSQPKMWIVAQIISFKVRPRPMYEVADIDTVGQTRRKTYLLNANQVIPLPTIDDIPLSKRKEFTVDQRILAVFPDTTTLYPAYVVARPKQRKLNTYLLRFDDDDVDCREIDIQYCVPMLDEFAE